MWGQQGTGALNAEARTRGKGEQGAAREAGRGGKGVGWLKFGGKRVGYGRGKGAAVMFFVGCVHYCSSFIRVLCGVPPTLSVRGVISLSFRTGHVIP